MNNKTRFVHGRFGMFIHWGLYSMAARHEWVRHLEQTPDEIYDRYMKYFDPDLYDPKLWAKLAADAGMKYFCITTKHHDGFCLWDTALTDFKATNSPAKRDLLRPMIDAFREEGISVGLYYSLLDWHHPEFIIDSPHPLRNHPQRAEMNAKRDQKKYIEFLHGQVRELLTNYGKIDRLFFDFSYPKWFAWPEGMEKDWYGKGRNDWDSEGLVKMIRQLQPDILINDRLDLMEISGGWDYKTPEQFEPRQWPQHEGKKVMWETCQTFSGSWGYHREENSSYKSTEQIIKMLVNTVSKGGNLILNVGPTARGEFDARAIDKLQGIGEWMKRHSRSIYGCTAAPDGLPIPQDCRYTYNPEKNRLYLHVYSWPFKHLHVDGLAGKVKYAQLLHDGSEVKTELARWYADQGAGSDGQNSITLELPVQKPNVEVPVVEFFLK